MSSTSIDLTTRIDACVFTALDFETTGLSAARDRVVEIGAVRFKLGRIEAEYATLVQPQVPIPELVIGVHGITDADVAEAPTFAAQAGAYTAFLGQSVLLAHHAAFDVAFHTCELRRAGLEPQQQLVLDTYHLARKVFPAAPSYKLSALLEWQGIAMGQAHRALPDALACARLFEACVAVLPKAAETTLAELIKLHPQCRVGMADLSLESHPAHLFLQQAISSRQDVQIEYRNARNELLQRRISPILLGGYGRYSYVEAFCHLRGENRQFRIDRILNVSAEQPVA